MIKARNQSWRQRQIKHKAPNQRAGKKEVRDILSRVLRRSNAHVTLYVCPIIVTCLALPGDNPVPERINETRLIPPHSDPRNQRRPSFADEKFRRSSEAFACRRGHEGQSFRIGESVANGRSGMGFYVRLCSVGRWRSGDLACVYKAAKITGVPGARGDSERQRNRASERGANGRTRYISPRESIFRVEFTARSSLTATGSDSRSELARFCPPRTTVSLPAFDSRRSLLSFTLPFTVSSGAKLP